MTHKKEDQQNLSHCKRKLFSERTKKKNCPKIKLRSKDKAQNQRGTKTSPQSRIFLFCLLLGHLQLAHKQVAMHRRVIQQRHGMYKRVPGNTRTNNFGRKWKKMLPNCTCRQDHSCFVHESMLHEQNTNNKPQQRVERVEVALGA